MKFLLTILLTLVSIQLWADKKVDIVVAADGSGDYKTLTEAINQLPYYNYQRLVIFVKNGVYNEKIRLEQDYITIQGESRDSTIIEYAQLRENWIKNPDIIGPAVINIEADDIVLDNLTIRNTQPELGPHAFAILGTGTRTIITNCSVRSKGGDTVSLWNYKHGMYYHANCYFEGCVDFVCPRGWCYIKDSEFHQLKKTATLWHAGVDDKNKKFVLNNCSFTGVEGWQLGRHHYEAAFYLIDCSFGKGMIDKPIYFVSYPDRPEKNRPYFWKDLYYFSGCKGDGFQYDWFNDNIQFRIFKIKANEMNARWTFNEHWDPEKKELPQIRQITLKEDLHTVLIYFKESVGVNSDLKIATANGKTLSLIQGKGRDILELKSEEALSNDDFKESFTLVNGRIWGNIASANERVYSKSDTISISNSKYMEIVRK